MTDHRPGIDDFTAFWIELAEVSLHRRGAPREQGWVEVLRDTRAVDLVPLTSGRWATVGEASVAAGAYDAARVRLGKVHARLRTGTRLAVVPTSAAVTLALVVTPERRGVLLVDLYVEDQSDEEPGRYVVKVAAIRAGGP